MNKRLIIGLGLVMTLVLLSLITVQINWIRNAYAVKENQFDQMVHTALTEVVDVIAQQETYNYLLKEFYPTAGIQNSATYWMQFAKDSAQINQRTATHEEDKSIDNNQISSIKSDSIDYDAMFKQHRKVLLEKQRYINRVLWRIMNQSPDIRARLDVTEVESILSEVLLDFGINSNFEFALSTGSDEMYFLSEGFKPLNEHSVYKVRLYPDEPMPASYYLEVYFPDKRNFIFRSMAFMGISSGVLTMLIVFTFGFTLFVIFRQKHLSEIKNDFVNNMTHELKTPISTISLASQMLGDPSIPDAAKNLNRISTIILQESKRLGHQVEKVLQIASIDKGKLEMNIKTVDIHDLIENVVGTFRLQIDAKGGLLIPSLHAVNRQVSVDPVHMSNVISNLIDNAIKFTPSNPEIYIETSNIGQQVFVSVKDNGIGISRANQKKVFDRFYRVPTGNLHNVKGFGLGLNYVKKIIEIHKGGVELESEPGQGSTFRFWLPLNK
ncbi:MAG: HAMP domain-containing histidine kinase [Bacteroidota bacterium]|nr:MAG: HAMP domain-containing histidine kinase [Bacteroidota bacterium]